MYSTILKNLIYPLYQINLAYDERYSTQMRLLDKSQWWSSSELEKFQLKRLKLLLQYSYDNVPYYHNMFKQLNFDPDGIKNVEDLRKLPILTKDIINKNYDTLCSKNYTKEKLIPYTTSGSTGTPMKFYIDKRWEACTMAAAYRAWNWAGYNIGDKIAYLWGAQRDLQNVQAISKFQDFLMRTKKLDAYNLNEDTMRVYAKMLAAFKPKIINTYASVIFLFSEFLKSEGIKDIRPTAILTTADMLYTAQRKVIEEVFDSNVFDYYSGRDTSLLAAECNEHIGYHVSIENAVVEYIEDDEPVSNGETGKLIITDLCNYAMPFIRYEIGDMGSPSDEKCPCGRNLPIMKTLKGRIFDFIITPEGKHIPGEFFHLILIEYDIKDIKEFQILQTSKNKIIVYIVKKPNAKNEEINRFIEIIQESVGEKVEVNLEYTYSINRTPSGKLRHVISNVRR